MKNAHLEFCTFKHVILLKIEQQVKYYENLGTIIAKTWPLLPDWAWEMHENTKLEKLYYFAKSGHIFHYCELCPIECCNKHIIYHNLLSKLFGRNYNNVLLKISHKVKCSLIFKQFDVNLDNSNSQESGLWGAGQLLRKRLNKRMNRVTMACKL